MSIAVNYHRWIVDEFEPYLGRRVAEVGAGSGSVSRLLLEKRITNLVAFEPSRNMYPLLEALLRGDGRAKAVNDVFTAGAVGESFDSIVYINVLEHIEDDQMELATAREALRPGGRVLLFAPALSWLFSDLDRRIGHFRRYSKKSLSRLVEEAGFTLVRARYFDLAGVVPWWVNFVLLHRSLEIGSVSLYDKLAVPLVRMMERAVAPPVGKNVLVVGRKDPSAGPS
jgi:SAM-dependent methyltransferase